MSSRYFIVSFIHFTTFTLVWKFYGCMLPNFLLSYYYCAANVVLFLLISVLTFHITKKMFLNDKVKPNKSVFITGCDSGFGHHLAKRLDSKGFHVFACCQFPSGAGVTALRQHCSNKLQILELDVTNDESVNNAVDFVKTNLKTAGLWAVVNNAGIQKGYYIDCSTMEDFKDTLEVNSLGPVRVTKAFLPLLKQTKGRVVNVTSIAAKGSFPLMMAYTMSKHAASAFNDCLRHEVDSYGIRVIAIEPEMFQTGMTKRENFNKCLDETFAGLEKTGSLEDVRKHRIQIQKFLHFLLDFVSTKVEIVVNDLESAVSAQYPKLTYKPRRNWFARLCLFVNEVAPVNFQILMTKAGLRFIDAYY